MMFVLWIILGLLVYAAIGAFAMGLETGLEPLPESEILWYVLGWPILYLARTAVVIGILPFKFGVWIHSKLNKEKKDGMS